MAALLIAAMAATFLFSLFILIGKLMLNRHLSIQERILGIQGEKSEKAAFRLRRKKKKARNSAAARTKKELEKLENELYDVGIAWSAARFLSIWATVSFGIPLFLSLLGLPVMICGVMVAVCAIGPVLYLKIRKKKRREELETQLVEAISVLCNALRAGHSFQQAMNSITTEMDGPIAEEFGRVFRETERGMTMQDSMNRMVERVGSDDLEMMCTAILIQREIGGNLSEVLENISGTIQSRLSLKSEIQTRTASGRLSGYLVGALPVVLLIGLSVLNADYAGKLFTTSLGNILLGCGAVLECIGFAVIQKVITIKY